MHATYIDRNKETKRALDQATRIHQMKLQQIANMGLPPGTQAQAVAKKSDAKKVQTSLQKFRQEKQKTHHFQASEKNLEISRENQILLSKLVEISNGKWSSVPKAKQNTGAAAVRRSVATQSLTRQYAPTSLNLGVRKKETERIERENHAFAKRLFDRQAVVTKRAHDSAFNEHMKYKRQIAKMGALKPRGKTSMRSSVRGAVSAAGMMIATGSQEFGGTMPYMDQQQQQMQQHSEMVLAMSQDQQNDMVQISNGEHDINPGLNNEEEKKDDTVNIGAVAADDANTAAAVDANANTAAATDAVDVEKKDAPKDNETAQ